MKDIMLDELSDVLIADNDLVIGFSDQQQQKHLLLTEKGDVKQL